MDWFSAKQSQQYASPQLSEEDTLPVSNYLLAADNHNVASGGPSWLNPLDWPDKVGDLATSTAKFSAVSVISGVNSFYNTAVAVGNWFGLGNEENDTEKFVAQLDGDLGDYYRENKTSADIAGFLATSLVPGVGGVKIFNWGQRALVAAETTGVIGGNLAKATGLLVPNAERYAIAAAKEINASTAAVKLLNANTTKALAAGIWQNTLEGAAFEIAIQATMFKSPVLENQDVGDIAWNVAVGGAFGGVVGGAFEAAKTFGFLKKAVRNEDIQRMPFISRPSFANATVPSQRIITLAYDADTAAVPVVLRNAEGTEVVNNYAVNKSLYDSKITKNFEEIRTNIRALSSSDDLGNIVASSTVPLPGQYGYSQNFLESFSGAIHVARPLESTTAEKAVSKAVREGKDPGQTIASRYVTLIGEDAGKVSPDAPVLFTHGDLYAGKDEILKEVRKYGYKPDQDWSVLNLKGPKAHLEAEARYIWANYLLKEVKPGTTINKYDIPVLERAYKDGVYDLKISDGVGPTLNTIQIGSKQELFELIRTAKLEGANKLLEQWTLKRGGHVPVEVSTDAISKVVNTKRAYLEGTGSKSEFDDLFAADTAMREYQETLKVKGIPESAKAEFTDPAFLPKTAKVVYDVAQDVQDLTPAVGDAIALFKAQQKVFEDGAKNVVAKVLGKYAESLPDLTDKALINANRTGAGAGLFSFENSNYGTLGSSMAWIGSITRAAKSDARKQIGDALSGSLVNLASKPEAALEFEKINQQVTRSGKQWILREGSDGEMYLVDKQVLNQSDAFADDVNGIISYEVLDETNSIAIKNSETLTVVKNHIDQSGQRTSSFREIRSQQGHTDYKDPEVFRPIRPDLNRYPFFAFVKDPRVTGSGHTTMIWAATEKDLAALIDKVPTQYKVVTKADSEAFFKARGEYEYSRTLHENYIDSDMANSGVFSNFFPKSDPDKIVNDILQQHYRESDVLVQDAVRLRYEAKFNWLEDLGKEYSDKTTSKFASSRERLEKTQDNPYFNYLKTALDISKLPENPLIYGFNKSLDEAVSKLVATVRETFTAAKSPEDLEKINRILDEGGMKPSYYDSALHVLANHEAPRGELTKFVRKANSLLSLFTLGLDPLNSLNNAIGSNILRMTELKFLTDAIKTGNNEAAGELSALAKIKVPGAEGDEIFAPTKLVTKAIGNFWKDDGALMSRYKDMGLIKDRAEQLKLLVDDFTLKGTESVGDLDARMSKAFARAKQLSETGEKVSANKWAEEFNRFVSANVMDQITELGIKHGLLDPAEAKAYINTFVNRVEGNIIASQRPLIFQGPIGQAVGLFQSYQFNLLQQLFRYSAEGSRKDLGMLLGLQGTLYGLQSLPAFQFINTHVVGQLSGNTAHRDAYDITYGITGRTAGDFILYGLPSNILQTNIYSRGDINPRQITVLPTSLQEIPLVQGWGKFLGSMKEMFGKVVGGGNIWESFLQGLEHNGISRPLAGFAQTLQGVPSGTSYSTSSKGSILYSNDLFAYANIVRLAGGRPLDEAITNDALFRVRTYEAARRDQMSKLAETVKTTLINGKQPSTEQLNSFAQSYAEQGGKQSGFNKWMMSLYKSSNVPQAQQLEADLKSPFAYKMQLLMGGSSE